MPSRISCPTFRLARCGEVRGQDYRSYAGTWRRTVRTGWVVDMRHYVDEETGDLPASMPERVVSLAIFLGAIVAWVTDHLPEGDEHTNVPCRRSPRRRRCRGDIIAQLQPVSGEIVWQCPLCGDNGWIHGWEETLWNRGGGARTIPSGSLTPLNGSLSTRKWPTAATCCRSDQGAILAADAGVLLSCLEFAVRVRQAQWGDRRRVARPLIRWFPCQ